MAVGVKMVFEAKAGKKGGRGGNQTNMDSEHANGTGVGGMEDCRRILEGFQKDDCRRTPEGGPQADIDQLSSLLLHSVHTKFNGCSV